MKVCTAHKEKLPEAGKGERGFTLIELSIVLVIIGLIVGGVLVGQDLIRAAEVRATVSQIEKYNTAVNTFRGKYNALPGDISATAASSFGFTARGSTAGEGDGNGVIQGIPSNGGAANGFLQGGETTTFWVDLSTANGLNVNLIDGSYSTATPITFTMASGAQSSYYPAAKLARGNYVYVYSTQGVNYFGIAPIASVAAGVPTMSSPSMTVQQAYQIDKKVDDGLPATGNVQADWGGNTGGTAITVDTAAPIPNAAGTDSTTTCYNNTTTAGAYSLSQNNGGGSNCTLSFRFQ